MNKSMPPSVIIPVLAYPDVRAAVGWLGHVFGFVERLRIGDHRAQLVFGEGSVIVAGLSGAASTGAANHSIMVRVADVNGHHAHAQQSGARIISSPADYPYGERQYTVEDLGGHHWTFSQTLADVDPQVWGGVLFE